MNATNSTILTSREQEILAHYARGLTQSRVARAIWVTEPTVQYHLKKARRKLGARTTREAVRLALDHDLIGFPYDYGLKDAA